MLLQEKIENIKMTEHQTQPILSTKESADSQEESDSNEDSIDKDDVFNDPDEELEVGDGFLGASTNVKRL